MIVSKKRRIVVDHLQHHIPAEIIGIIVHRLPAESMLRCRAVCKEWKSIIDDPLFPKPKLNMILTLTEDDDGLEAIPLCSLINYYSKAIPNYTLTIPPHNNNINHTFTSRACRGFLLFMSEFKQVYALWNPSSGEWLDLPHGGLCFRYSFSSGLGYDVKTNDYKVVRLACKTMDSGFDLNTLIYSVKSGAWRKTKNFPKRYVDVTSRSLFANNSLYWLTNSYGRDKNVVILLDLSSETYSKLPLPGCISDIRFMNKLFAVDECLFLSCCRHDVRIPCWELWILQDCEKGKGNWKKLLVLVHMKITQRDYNLIPVAYVKSQEQVLIRYGERFMWFDLKKKECGKTVTIKGVGRSVYSCGLLPVSVDRFTRNHRDDGQSFVKRIGSELEIRSRSWDPFTEVQFC